MAIGVVGVVSSRVGWNWVSRNEKAIRMDARRELEITIEERPLPRILVSFGEWGSNNMPFVYRWMLVCAGVVSLGLAVFGLVAVLGGFRIDEVGVLAGNTTTPDVGTFWLGVIFVALSAIGLIQIYFKRPAKCVRPGEQWALPFSGRRHKLAHQWEYVAPFFFFTIGIVLLMANRGAL